MGATGWYYATPYDADPEDALQRLRQDTFVAGDYKKPWEVLRLPAGFVFPWRVRLLIAAARAVLLAAYLPTWVARGFRGPGTIEEALLDARESGTHSILDIMQTSDVPEFAAATPLGRRKLQELFGTVEPTVGQVNGQLAAIAEGVRRWEAVYVTVYREGRPDEIVFIGCSGD